VWYRSGSPRGAPWTNQWGWVDPRIDAIIDNAATEVDPARRRALYTDFVRAVQTELPLWMPIEQIFVSVFNRRVRNGGNNPRWASSSWHDTWLAS
jgi:peptide/nickel transport system substrate-binding protein